MLEFVSTIQLITFLNGIFSVSENVHLALTSAGRCDQGGLSTRATNEQRRRTLSLGWEVR
ncbi:hypothetical protein E2C01_082077 [Portunus trituberculatus]|uniref:Uncharacterized protein n=1 Tax=Portunus trituberculatus TaxID=210409 RepID=A0A5B7IP07_PORTR|nr:hypothetical protein [Portunus trituberculatus]